MLYLSLFHCGQYQGYRSGMAPVSRQCLIGIPHWTRGATTVPRARLWSLNAHLASLDDNPYVLRRIVRYTFNIVSGCSLRRNAEGMQL